MEIADGYEWSTHSPLLRGLVATFEPKFILELGMGLFSTPIFINYNPEELICIENDAAWFSYMKEKLGGKQTMLLHKLDVGVTKDTFLKQLTLIQKNNIINYYKELSDVIRKKEIFPKLLFVDNFACCRTLAINTLYKNFDIIAYHDCEPLGVSYYEYYFIEDIKKEFNHYILKTPRSWAAVFIKSTLSQADLAKNILSYINDYCYENSLNNKQVYLEKQY